MRLGGIVKNSFIDFPGKISCVIFTSGCNFACPYCHNPGLATGRQAPPAYLNDDWLERFLDKRKGLLDGVVVSGGEPTLQPDLAAFCRRLKSFGYAVKLDTNGSRPEVLRQLLAEGLVDYVAMDIKTEPHAYIPDLAPGGFTPSDIIEAIDIIKSQAPSYEFRTTCAKPLVTPTAIQKILTYIEGAQRYCLQHLNLSSVLMPDFFSNEPASAGVDWLEDLRLLAAPRVRECIVR